MEWTARLLVYLAVGVLASARDSAKVALTGCVLLSHVLLTWRHASGASTDAELVMNQRRVMLVRGPGSVKKYSRRLVMAEELVREMGRRDFAVRLGMINPDTEVDVVAEQVVTM
jgi:hypothetical protein